MKAILSRCVTGAEMDAFELLRLREPFPPSSSTFNRLRVAADGEAGECWRRGLRGCGRASQRAGSGLPPPAWALNPGQQRLLTEDAVLG